MELGKKIKQLRLGKGLTQEALAEILNISPQAISKWETDTAYPDIMLLPQLSVYFGITIDELFTLNTSSQLERIEHMLESKRELTDQDVQYAQQTLTDLLRHERYQAKANQLLAGLYNHRAKQMHETAKQYALAALELAPNEKANHVALVEASNGIFSDWNYYNRHLLCAYYETFIQKNPACRGGYLWYLDQLLADGRLQEAGRVLQQLKQVDSGYISMLYEGKIQKAAGDHAQAFQTWDQMVAAYPDIWQVYLSRGDELVLAEQYPEALLDYQKAIDIQPKPRYIDGYEAMAHVYEIQKDYKHAILMYEAIIAMTKSEWNITFGEAIDHPQREIDRLKLKESK